MSRFLRLPTFFVFAPFALALALSGCGGGSGGTAPAPSAVAGAPTGGGTAGSGANPSDAVPLASVSIRSASVEVSIAAGTPFDAATQDNGASLPSGTPADGKTPEIVPFVNADGTLDVAWQDQATNMVRIVRNAASASPAAPIEVAGLGKLMGFARDAEGAMFVATSSPENLSRHDPLPSLAFRTGIVRVVKLDAAGLQLWSRDVTNAFADNTTNKADALYNPMVAGSGRLAVGGGRVMLHFAKYSDYDEEQSTRHQLQMYIALDAASGAQNAKGVWDQSHSFDQRLAWDAATGTFVGLSLGDAYQRAITLQRVTADASSNTLTTRAVFAIKGGQLNYNQTYTKLGGMARDSAGGWVTVFATENSAVAAPDPMDPENIVFYNAPRNLALVRVLPPSLWNTTESTNPYDIQVTDTSMGQPFDVSVTFTSPASPGLNKGVVWLTAYADLTAENVERPRIAAIGGDRFLLAWEKWTRTAHVATYAMVVDARGRTLAAPVQLPSQRINRGDDIVAAGNKVYIVTGRSGAAPKLLVTSLTVE